MLLTLQDILQDRNEYTEQEIEKLKLTHEDIELRGRYIACKFCKKQFKIIKAETRIKWWEDKQICPFCQVSWCTKPAHEKLLFDLQDIFLEHERDPKFLNEMARQLYPYTQSLILKHFNVVIKSAEHLQEIKNDVVTLFLEDFLKKSTFKIQKSFAGQLRLKIRQIIYPPTNAERMQTDISLDYDFDDEHKVSERFNKSFKNHLFFEDTEDKLLKASLCDYISNLLFQISDYCTPTEDYLRLVAIYLYFTKGEAYSDKLFQEEQISVSKDGVKTICKTKTYQKIGKLKYLESLAILREELIKLESTN